MTSPSVHTIQDATTSGHRAPATNAREEWHHTLRGIRQHVSQLQDQYQQALGTLIGLGTLLEGVVDTPAPQTSENGRADTGDAQPNAAEVMSPPPSLHHAGPAVEEPSRRTPDGTPAPSLPAAGTAAHEDLGGLLREVIADVTGYPEAALTPDVMLEEELGIDSIKRVQILAAIRDRVPGLGSVDAAAMAQLRTIAEVTERLVEAAAAGGQPS
ncbi:acyl carrier protein [Streptomyces sp. NPDC002779]|uniref:acyl carrier protein n=1 Tax=Streptomyces sp. NPDC002779 TaxID=3364664 RepID=UPI0036B5A846